MAWIQEQRTQVSGNELPSECTPGRSAAFGGLLLSFLGENNEPKLIFLMLVLRVPGPFLSNPVYSLPIPMGAAALTNH